MYPEPEKFWTKENPHISKGESNMNNVTWFIKSTDVDCGSPYSSPEITVELSGMIDRETKINEIIEDLHRRIGDPKYSRSRGISKPYVDPMRIKDVIFNDPATIVFWADGTKTVVKCQEGDEFDPEKGLTMAIAKKVYGNKGHYFETVKKWCGPYYERRAKIQPWVDAVNDAVEKLKDCDV
jgi:hypothetical protein